jgi:uncharacterized cofD-like protein
VLYTSSVTERKIVVIGGGTGTSVVLTGLRDFPNLDLTAIISVADSGGSTGRLRDEFGFLPVGDLRQALSALSTTDNIRELLLYRFDQGNGLKGHNLGNLILTALQAKTGSTAQALELATRIFRIRGQIYPVTLQNVELVIKYTDGTVVVGEHHLNPGNLGGKKIAKIKLSPQATLYSKAKQALASANLIVIGPGDVYASLMPNLVVSGVKKAMQATSAKIVYVVNLMTSYMQTHEMTVMDHVEVIERALNRSLDYIIINSQPISPIILRRYRQENDVPVVDDAPQADPRVIRAPLITTAKVKPQQGDILVRSFLRHDPVKVAHLLNNL